MLMWFTNFPKKEALAQSAKWIIEYRILGDRTIWAMATFLSSFPPKIWNPWEKELGDEVTFEIYEDSIRLRVEVTAVLQVFLSQDREAEQVFEQISDGKKRSLIYTIKPIMDIDKQV